MDLLGLLGRFGWFWYMSSICTPNLCHADFCFRPPPGAQHCCSLRGSCASLCPILSFFFCLICGMVRPCCLHNLLATDW